MAIRQVVLTAKTLIYAYLATLAIETAIAWLMGIKKKDSYYVIILANLITNPLINLANLLMVMYKTPDTLRILLIYVIGELCVISAEGFIYRRLFDEKTDGMKYAVIANCVSLFTGIIVSVIV